MHPFKLGDIVRLRKDSVFYGQSHSHTGYKSFYAMTKEGIPTDEDLNLHEDDGVVTYLFDQGELSGDPDDFIVRVKWLGNLGGVDFAYRAIDIILVKDILPDSPPQSPEEVMKLIKEMRDEIAKT